MAEREHQPHRDRPLSLLHQLPGDIVDGGDVVGVHRVAKAETVGEKRGPQEHGKAVKRDQRPEPRRQIEPQQESVYGNDLGFGAARLIVEQGPQEGDHRHSFQNHASLANIPMLAGRRSK